MDRRDFLKSAGLGLAAGLTPSLAAAAPGPAVALRGTGEDGRVQRFVQRVRHRREGVEQRLIRRFARREVPADIATAQARATAALTAVQLIPQLSPRDQVHHSVQALTRELLEEVGRGVYALRDVLSRSVVADDPASGSVDAVLNEVQAGILGEDVLGEPARRVAGHTLDEIRARLHAEGVRGLTQRELRRLERLVATSERLADAGRVGLLTPPDEATRIQLTEARGWWGPLAATPLDPPEIQALLVVGLIASGIAVLFVGYLVVVSVVCALACEAPGLLILALLGATIIGLLIMGMVYIVKRLSRPPGGPREPSVPRQPDRPLPPPDPSLEPGRELTMPTDPLAGPARSFVQTECRRRGYPADGPVCAAQTNAAVGALARGMPLSEIGRLLDYLPEFTLFELTLSWTRRKAGGPWEPDPALALARDLYTTKNWTFSPDTFRPDVAAISAARSRGLSTERIQQALQGAKRPGSAASVLAR